MEIYVNKLPKNCYDCEFCGKFKAPAERPEVECMHCNLVKKFNTRSDFCPLKTIQSVQNKEAVECLKKVSLYATECGQDDYFHYADFQTYIQNLIKEYGGGRIKMLIDTPYGKAEVPDCYTDEYKIKTDKELLETLLNQNNTGNGFIDPILVQLLSGKNLISKGETFRQLEEKVKKLGGKDE